MPERWQRYLLPYEVIRHESSGRSSGEFLICHKTIGDLEREPNGDGEDAARFGAQAGAPSWHFTVGGAGSAYKNLEFWEEGAHDLGANSITVGIEHDTAGPVTPEMLETSARIAAAWCHWRGRRPSRRIIIGHVEDHLIGGDSTHTDPTQPGPWDWDRYMDLVHDAYEGRWLADMGMTEQEKEQFDRLQNTVKNMREKVHRSTMRFNGADDFYELKGVKPADFDERHVDYRRGWRDAERGLNNPQPETGAA